MRGGAVVLDRIISSSWQSIFLGLSGSRRTRWPSSRFSEMSSIVSDVKVWSRWKRHFDARNSGPLPSLIWWWKYEVLDLVEKFTRFWDGDKKLKWEGSGGVGRRGGCCS